MAKTKSRSGTVDWWLILIVVALLVLGLMSLYSATLATYRGEVFFRRQLQWLVVGLVAGAAAYYIPYPIWQKLAFPMMLGTLVLLAATVAYAHIVGVPASTDGLASETRHLGNLIGLGNSGQPGVLARLVAIIYIAAWLSSKGSELNKITYGLIPFGMILGLVAGLVVLQPDLSTAMLIVVVGIAMFFFAGGDPIQIFLIGIAGGGIGALLARYLEYARKRLEAYIGGLQDPSKTHDHMKRAIEAISQGGILGVGLGAGRYKFGWLPMAHTDSIFAVVAEEMGLVGSLLVIGLFVLLGLRGYRITLSTPDPFGSLVAFGVTMMILAEAMLNIMVMLGLFPTTGTALPFFSYGGTEMLITLGGLGLVLGISKGRPKGDWDAILDRWWGDWRARLSGSRRRSGLARSRS